jgi:acyl carrier protein
MPDEAVYRAIYAAIDDTNPSLPADAQLEKTPETVLFGDGSSLNSLALVNLIVAVEEGVERELGVAITLADERAMSAKQSPFRTVRSLAEYTARLVGETAGA